MDDAAAALRGVSLGDRPVRDDNLLVRLGFVTAAGVITEDGRRFEEAYWIVDDANGARSIWRDALLRLPETQALMQVLHGRGAVRVVGAHYSMARHGFVGVGDVAQTRAFLQILNNGGIVAYSKRNQSVRVVAPLPEEIAARVRVVEPERPYSNVLALREILRACEDYIHWAEPHLPAKALEPLSYEADAAKITEIKLLPASVG